MSNEVKLTVRQDLDKIIQALVEIRDHSKQVEKSFSETGKGIDDALQKGTKATEQKLGQSRSLFRRMADQIKDDLRSLASINALGDSLKISNQFRGSIKQSIELGDQIRKLGSVFGIAENRFVTFQSKLMRGLGQIGLSSEAASNALGGLSMTQVRGEGNLIEYSKSAGMLASISGQQGREGDIASGIARVLTARGQDPNDIKAMRAVAEDLRRARNATGQNPVELLNSMEKIFAQMPKDLQKIMSTRGLAQLAATAQVAGPGGTEFLTQLLTSGTTARKAFEARGFKIEDMLSDQGLDTEKFGKAAKDVFGMFPEDPRLMAKTLGLSDEGAEGFRKLYESLDRVKKVSDQVSNAQGDLEGQYKTSLGFFEAFRANLERVKGFLAPVGAAVGQMGAKIMGGAATAEGTTGDLASTGIVAGGGILAALLAGYGLKGIGKGLGGGIAGSIATGAAASAVTGKDVQPVYVVNAGEIGGGGLLGGAAGGGLISKVPQLLAGGAAVAGGAAAGYGLSELASSQSKKFKEANPDSWFTKMDNKMNLMIAQMLSGRDFAAEVKPGQQKVVVELNERQLKATKQPSRGASF